MLFMCRRKAQTRGKRCVFKNTRVHVGIAWLFFYTVYIALVLSAGLNSLIRTFLFHEHNRRLSTLDWESVASPNGWVQIFQALAHKSGKKRGRQIGWCSICSIADVVLICGDEESCRFTGQCKFLLSPTATSGGLWMKEWASSERCLDSP